MRPPPRRGSTKVPRPTLLKRAGTVRGGVAVQVRDGAERQVVRLDPVVGREPGQLRHQRPMAADRALDEPFVGQPVDAARFAVARRRREDQGQVARLLRVHEALFQRHDQRLRRADADEARAADAVAVADQRDRLVGTDDLVAVVHVRSVEDDDLTDRPAFVQQVEAAVDVFERDPAGEQLVDRQPPLLVKRDVTRHVARRHAGADVAALERALLGHQAHRGQRPGRGRWRQAGGDGGAATARDAVGEVERADRAGEFEGELDAARAQVADLLQRIRLAGIDGVGGAQLARQLQLVVGEVDGDDLPRAGGCARRSARPDRRRRGRSRRPTRRPAPSPC